MSKKSKVEVDADTAILVAKKLLPDKSKHELAKILKEKGVCCVTTTYKHIKDEPLESELIGIEQQHTRKSAESGLMAHNLLCEKLEEIQNLVKEGKKVEEKHLPWIKEAIVNLRKTLAQSKQQPSAPEPSPRLLQMFQIHINQMLGPEGEDKGKQ